MVGEEREIRDAPGCPLLGLAADRRTRHTYPHPGHRCYARHSRSSIEPGRQSTHCLSLIFAACDRYQVWQRLAAAGRRPDKRPSEQASTRPASTAATAAAGVASVIHVCRTGDSLARIAAAYGLSVEQIAAANDLPSLDAIADGQRLVIPLGGLQGSALDVQPPLRADRSG